VPNNDQPVIAGPAMTSGSTENLKILKSQLINLKRSQKLTENRKKNPKSQLKILIFFRGRTEMTLVSTEKPEKS